MLYRRNKAKQLDPELFRNPTSEYRATPFWAWNTKLDPEMLLEQIEVFKQMGFGGFHIHARTGLETPYLSDEFMDCVKLCSEKAIQEEMLCWLYDEDRYPSGAAGGIVTKDLRYRARNLLLSPNDYPDFAPSRAEFDRLVAQGHKPKGYYLASYCVVLKDGYLHSYHRIGRSAGCSQGAVWHAYCRLAKEEQWFNGQAYVDVLNEEAIKQFVRVTHERYYEAVGKEFGKSIPAIFTDEPQIKGRSCLSFAEAKKDVTMGFTDDLPDTYRDQYGVDLLDVLPELFWELPEGQVSQARYRYHDHLTERFAAAFSDTLGEWCEKHSIALTGHLMSEASLYSQSLALGEAMRLLRSFQLPGIDILCDAKEFSTAKQAASIAHQYGREGVLSELYGVTHWYHDFKGHKLQGDWQAALGVTVRVPHLAWLSMAGEGKRDWPASISFQSPWYREYPYVEDHFARLNTALTRGKCDIKIGVIHPIESMWLAWGPNDQTGETRAQYDENFRNLIDWLLYGLLDFDFISEALLPDLCPAGSCPLKVGLMEYMTIIVPDCKTLRSTTLARLEQFRKAGGRIVFLGSVPTHVDAAVSGQVQALAKQCEVIPFTRVSLLEALEPERVVEVRAKNGKLAGNLVHQLRDDQGGKWLFLCHVNRKRNRVDEPERYSIGIKGRWDPEIYDTITGEIRPCLAQIEGGTTLIVREMFAEDSLLLFLKPGWPSSATVAAERRFEPLFKLADPVDFVLSEPNALLLDRAEYAFDQGEFRPAEELLRIDNEFRKLLGYPLRMHRSKQPWADEEGDIRDHLLRLRFTVLSDIPVSQVRLAMEEPERAAIFVNRQRVEAVVDGYFVDKAIKTLPIPDLTAGANKILIEIPFGRRTNVEWCYLLGDFGVRVKGAHAMLERPPKVLFYGDWVSQGMPFYAGSVTYRCQFELDSLIEDAVLEIPHFAAPVIAVNLDGKRQGLIAYAPHRLSLGTLSPGTHQLEITAYGNRYNAFGTLHNANDEYQWYGPDSYRTTGSQWTDSYVVREMGVLSAPLIGRYV
ncbi:MAG: hypothetical protein GX228_05940 [Firmicutes bacterium]|jgi:hypothetical protein|nr:hypothetical protein [Bacillota bacterium]NLL88464.1 hypothetical protein [Bacillota bacterium]